MADRNEPGLSFHPSARRIVQFGEFRSDLSDGSLWRGAEEIRLPPRALSLLLHLIERPGRVVSKPDLMDAVWKDANVGERSLTEAIGLIRQALGDDPEKPTYIQTVHRRGYRFIAPLAVEAQPAMPRAVPASDPRPPDVPDVPATAVPGPQHDRAPWKRSALVMAAVIAFLALVVVTLWRWPLARVDTAVTRATINLPPQQAPAPVLSAHTVMALSPDGREAVYVAGTSGAYQLFLRRMNEFEARPLSGTAGGHGPFFSPDGKDVGFFAEGKLKRLALVGGEPVTIAEAAGGMGGWWTDRQTILFAPEVAGGLWEVDAAGGQPREVVAAPSGSAGYRWPQLLPDGRTIIATRWGSDKRNATVVALRDGGGGTELARGATYGRYIANGYLLFVRDTTLMAARYAPGDAGAGRERPVLERVMAGSSGAAQYALSRTGALIYIPDDPDRMKRTLAIVDADGRQLPATFEPQVFQNLTICGERIAVTVAMAGTSDIWIASVGGGPLTRLTSSGSAVEPVWEPRCRALTYSLHDEMYTHPTDGSEAPRRLQPSRLVQAPSSWTPDAARLVYTEVNPVTRGDIWMLTASGGQAQPLLVSPASETGARVSPDGRWLAYQSNETGRAEVYLRPFLRAGDAQRISTGGGNSPAWSFDGAVLHYRNGARILSVDVRPGTGVDSTKEARFVELPAMVTFKPLATGPGFVVVQRVREHLPLTTMNLVLNWTEEVAERP